MGRSSAGGGGHSGGGGSFRSSSGHRSSGAGRSSRSSGGVGGSSGFGGSSSNRDIHIHNRNYYEGGFFGGFGARPYYRQSGSFLGNLIAIILVVIIVIGLFAAIRSDSGYESAGIQVSTVDREKLPDTMTKETPYFQDDLDWIGNSYQLEKGMRYFYQTTGVFPYLWITDNVDGEAWPSDDKIDEKLNQMYDKLFDDEGHAIVMYLDAGGGRYITRCLRGASAKTVLDAEATEILLDYLDAYAASDMDDETYFATCFTKAADRMMSRTTNSKDVAKTGIIAVTVVVIVIAVIVFFIRRRKLKLEQAKVDSEILNSKL